ncbi:MAG: glycoside hydrolase [Oxalobacteraceae bacterium]|nr:MAG: glycoside hydrolase [Oxalobacteraceae bacterium]
MIITAEILLKVAPRAKKSVVQGLAVYMPAAMEKFEINTPLRIKHFLGQASHETDGFATLVEYASGRAYEGRKDLGNTVAGYGVKYKGRGIFQLTGFSNYKIFGEKLGVDLVRHPDLAADPQWAVMTACEYWANRKLNTYADADDIRTITKKINGGLNGYDDRVIRTANAAKAMPDIMKKTGWFS